MKQNKQKLFFCLGIFNVGIGILGIVHHHSKNLLIPIAFYAIILLTGVFQFISSFVYKDKKNNTDKESN